MDKVRITFNFHISRKNLARVDFVLDLVRSMWRQIGASYVKIDFVVLED